MVLAPRELIRRLSGPEGQKLVKYSVASIVAVVISEVCLVVFNGVVGMSAWVSSSLATAIAALPNYYMNRKWAWGKHGRSHVWREVVPFWVLAFVGWALSTFSVYLMEQYDKHHHVSHFWTTASVAVVYIAAFGVLWVAKFIIFNKVMFVHRHHQDRPHQDRPHGDHHHEAHGGSMRTGEPAGASLPG
ncbi:MAG TPA: GtrA family protein [Acidimicrobiales bacterium]|nr:GtrA family protein [Acidimicrobiales bacterium]